MSQALSRVRIDGYQSRALLAKGCALDLHPRRFPSGRCARTRLAGMPVIVRCVGEFASECVVPSSHQAYFASYLQDAAVEFVLTNTHLAARWVCSDGPLKANERPSNVGDG